MTRQVALQLRNNDLFRFKGLQETVLLPLFLPLLFRTIPADGEGYGIAAPSPSAWNQQFVFLEEEQAEPGRKCFSQLRFIAVQRPFPGERPPGEYDVGQGVVKPAGAVGRGVDRMDVCGVE